jgi:hypothetical protein
VGHFVVSWLLCSRRIPPLRARRNACLQPNDEVIVVLAIVCQLFKLDPPLQYLHLHRLSTILDSEDEEEYGDEALE